MDLVGHLFGGAAAGKFVATVIGEGGTTGIMETVTQQLGLGLMLSTLLITVPPMAGMWFNGVMGSFSATQSSAMEMEIVKKYHHIWMEEQVSGLIIMYKITLLALIRPDIIFHNSQYGQQVVVRQEVPLPMP